MAIIATEPTAIYKASKASFSWKDSAAVQRMLDAISMILADEYCKTAIEHPELFSSKG